MIRFRAKTRRNIGHRPGEMNGIERAYAAVLEARKAAGEIRGYRFEDITLKLADDTRYVPDFTVYLADGTIEMHECKAEDGSGKPRIEQHSRVKIKVAADKFNEIVFVLASKATKKNGGGWTIKEIC